MNAIEFNKKQHENLMKIVFGPQPNNRREKDIYNLKYVRYSIGYGSIYYRSGIIATLDRAIKRLEEEDA